MNSVLLLIFVRVDIRPKEMDSFVFLFLWLPGETYMLLSLAVSLVHSRELSSLVELGKLTP